MTDPTKPLVIEEKKEIVEKLNERQELFCQLYATDREFFGNGVQSYIEAYNPKRTPNWYKSAMADSSRLLSNVKIANRINELLELKGLNDGYVDKQLEFLITQFADFKSKLGGIKEYNQLKGRIVDKLAIAGGGVFTVILQRHE